MARKDVDLVIRAKDEAAKVVKAITEALNDFVEAQTNVVGRSGKTESSLGSLGAAIGALDKQIKGLDVGTKLTGELNKAATAVGRLDKEVTDTSQGVAKLRKETDAASASAERYASKLAGAAAAQERQKAAVKSARGEQRALSSAYEQSVAAQEKFARRQAQLPGLIEKQSAAVDKASARYDELSAEIAGTDQPSKTLSRNFESSSRALASQSEKLSRLRREYSEIGSKLRAAGSAVTIFGGQAKKAGDDLARQERALGKIGQNYADLSVKSKSAAGQQKDLEAALGKTEETLRRQTGALDKAEENYVDLAVASGQAEQAIKALAAASLGNLGTELQRQRRSMLEAKREYVELTAASTKLASEIGKAGVPTREMGAAFDLTKAKAAAAKVEYQEQRQTLELMGRAYRESGADIESVRNTQERFVALQDRQSAALSRNTAQLNKQKAAVSALYGASEKLSRVPPAKPTVETPGKVNSLADAYRRLYGEKRKSLSITQRLRGEVLSLVAAYGGIYGVIELLGGVVNAYQTIEAAQARLNVATGGDFKQTAEEMDFLRRTADRLGVDLGTLSTEYSKFAIATKGTSLEGQNTRKIFISVAEAARVNRSSTEELSGVFVALTQIVSKGAVQMEELRQQLGDRLPGALKIMADGLGVTTGELIKMMEAGEITEAALVPFAEELDKRFGPGLGAALASTSVSLGRLKNAAFQALVTFGRGGFIDAFTDLANRLTEVLKSGEFESFILRASSAMGSLLDVVAVLAENFQLVVAAGTGFLGLKLTPLVVYLFSALGKLPAVLTASAAGLVTFTRGSAAAGAAATGASAGVGRLTLAIRALMSSTGVGLIITAVAAGIGLWATRTDEVTDAMNSHRKIVDQVKNAYDAVGGSVEDWRKALKDLTATEAKANLDRITNALDEMQARLDQAAGGNDDFFTNFFGFNLAARQEIFNVPNEFKAAIAGVIEEFRNGELDAEGFIKKLDETIQKMSDGSEESTRYGEAAIQAARDVVKLENAADEAGDVVKAVSGDSDEAGDALERLGNKAKAAADVLADELAAKAEMFNAALEEMGKLIPEVARELEYLGESKALEKLLLTAIQTASSFGDVARAIQLAGRAQMELDSGLVNDVVGGSLVDRIIGVESGGNPNAKNPLSSATGLGQFIESTWLSMFKTHFPDRASSLTDAAILELRKDATLSREMVTLYLKQNAKSLQKAGIAINDANLYLSHFLGAGGARALLGSAPGTIANDVLGAGQISANASILDGKTREQVIAWAQRKVGISKEELSIAEDFLDVEKKQAEEAQKAADKAAEDAAKRRADTAETLADGEFEISQQELINRGKEREAEIEAAIRAAKQADPDITAAEIASITEQTGKLFDLKKAHEDANKAGKGRSAEEKAAAEASKVVNQLLAQRVELEKQLKIAKEEGDNAKQEELRAKIEEVNGQLTQAIDNARGMWEAVGGGAADAAIAKLDTAALKTQRFSKEADNSYFSWKKVGDLFVDGLTNAFGQFAKAVAEGKNIGEAARDAFLQFAADFLIQIGQMIIKQALLNALQGATGGGGIFGGLFGTGHTGGRVGSSRVGSGNSSRRVNPAVFAGAMRYHTGGVVGLRPGEVPIIAKQNEEMLTEDDPRHYSNVGKGGSSGTPKPPAKIINAFDAPGFLEAALSSDIGGEVILNYVRANRSQVRAALDE